MEHYFMISDAAKEVHVESHVLRYWEEELKLPIRRNELGHRYYTREDVERFKQIKKMKEKGLQLKAIKMILKDGMLNVLVEKGSEAEPAEVFPGIDIVGCREVPGRERQGREVQNSEAQNSVVETEQSKSEIAEVSKEEKAKRLQWLLRQLIRETLQENNEALCHEIRNSVVKELDYQFRNLEEREDEREVQRIHRDEAYYKKMDELLRNKSRAYGKKAGSTEQRGTEHGSAEQRSAQMKEGRGTDKAADIRPTEKKGKKKRHSIF